MSLETEAEKEIALIKELVDDTVLSGEYFKCVIIPVKDGHFAGEFHVVGPFGRQCFNTMEAACKWSAYYFMYAANSLPYKELKEKMDAENDA